MADNKLSDLDEILQLLNENNIYEKIDAPIDEILRKYSYSISEDKTQREFISIITEFLNKLKNQGVLVSMDSNEFSNVFWYLEKYYEGEGSQGYERALNDYEEYGIEIILEETCEALKMDQRSRYLFWVHDTKINYLEWNDKLKLIEEIINQFKKDFNPRVSNLPNEQLTPFLKELINMVITGTQPIKSILETKLFN